MTLAYKTKHSDNENSVRLKVLKTLRIEEEILSSAKLKEIVSYLAKERLKSETNFINRLRNKSRNQILQNCNIAILECDDPYMLPNYFFYDQLKHHANVSRRTSHGNHSEKKISSLLPLFPHILEVIKLNGGMDYEIIWEGPNGKTSSIIQIKSSPKWGNADSRKALKLNAYEEMTRIDRSSFDHVEIIVGAENGALAPSKEVCNGFEIIELYGTCFEYHFTGQVGLFGKVESMIAKEMHRLRGQSYTSLLETTLQKKSASLVYDITTLDLFFPRLINEDGTCLMWDNLRQYQDDLAKK